MGSGPSGLTAREMLQHTQVDGHPGAHVLGAFETRVTVYSQQVRALNLIYALFAEARIATGDAIAVIGGGVAGLTASAAAAQRGCRVTLFEQQAELLHLFAECDKRWL